MSRDGLPEIRVDADGGRWMRAPDGYVEEPPLDQPLDVREPPEPFRRPAAAAPAPRWVGPLFLTLGALLVPWTVVLAVTLPTHAYSSHYRVAWVGFDVMLLVVLVATGWFAYRRSAWIEVSAAVAGTMLFLDAWFDVMTSGDGWSLIEAIATAVFVEVPLGVLAMWISRHAAAVTERSTMFLFMRSQRQAVRLRQRASYPGRNRS